MLYSLKNLPERYPRPAPPKMSLWLFVLASMLVISVILMRIFGRYIDNRHFWLIAIGTPIAAWTVSFVIRMWVWSLHDSKANGFDSRREQWILREPRRARRALQVLNTTFITAYPDMEKDAAAAMLNNQSIITAQADWNGKKSKRVSRILVGPEDTPELLIPRLL